MVRLRPSTGLSLGESIELIVTLVAFLLPDSRSERRIDLPPVEGVLGLEEVKCMLDVESLSCKYYCNGKHALRFAKANAIMTRPARE